MQLMLIRHGQAPANVRGELSTRIPGLGLTPLGERQAAALPDVLGGRGIDAIFVSLMVRTHLTAAPLAADRRFRPVELDGIHEVEAGGLEDRSDADADDTYQDVLACWAGGDTSVSMPGGPDGTAFLGRFDASVAAVLRSGAATAVMFSHGASIRAWTGARADNLDATFVRTLRLGNTGLVEMRGDFATGWTCVSWRGDPAGGEDLVDRRASDAPGEAATATADGRAPSPRRRSRSATSPPE